MTWSIGLTDKIGTLSHGAGAISLLPSILTIGGRQYRTQTLTRTIATDVTLIANTRYMIYATVIGGVVALRISNLVRSSYLLANPNSELVGSFQAGDTALFGAFFNIVGIPKLQISNELIPYSGLIFDANSTNVQSPSPITNYRGYDIVGKYIFLSGSYYQTAVVGIAGVGRYAVRLPLNLLLNSTSGQQSDVTVGSNSGSGHGFAAGDIGGGSFVVGMPSFGFLDRFGFQLSGGAWGQGGGTIFPLNVAFTGLAWNSCRAILSGYSDTQLLDL